MLTLMRLKSAKSATDSGRDIYDFEMHTIARCGLLTHPVRSNMRCTDRCARERVG